YDLSLPPNPVPAGMAPAAGTPQADAYLHWLDLTTAYGGVSQALVNEDPSRHGIEYVDSTLAAASAGSGVVTSYTPGFDTPPPGPVSAVDYLVTGQITGSEGAYTVSVSLQDAATRAQIASGQATFASSLDSMTAAQQAASQLEPLLTKIRAYQTKLRHESNEMAISPPLDQPQVSPAKRNLTRGQSSAVKLSLVDCDGLPLAHRTLKLRATHGRISPASVRTDARGVAHATFRATGIGAALLTADYGPYQTVTHRTDQRRGSAVISVKASGIWEMRVDATWQEHGSVQGQSGLNSSSGDGTVQAGVQATELIRTANPFPANPEAQGWDTIGGQANAYYSITGDYAQTLHTSPALSCRDTQSQGGSTAHGLPGLETSSYRRRQHVVAELVFEVKGVSHQTHHCSPYDSNAGDDTSAETESFQLQNNDGMHGPCRLTGNVHHGYTVTCRVNGTRHDGALLIGGPVAAAGRFTVTFTPL
ncbi:MAG: hypothetical protein ACRDNS_32975, partial [Trebonia sp.]